jgi:hypothetical protein
MYKHPFHDQILSCQSSPEKLADFIKDFMKDFSLNSNTCQAWVKEAQIKMLSEVRVKNSMLDIILTNFKKTKNAGRKLF